MKGFLIIVLLCFLHSRAFSQTIEIISPSVGTDSSYYHILKVNDNEYWAGGKNGVLKRIDTLGNTTEIDYPSFGLKILKLELVADYIFISTDNAVIYRYDLNTQEFIYKRFDGFENRAFYDMIGLEDGNILVCGGNTAIVRSSKKFPTGFIAIIDHDLNTINVVWKNYRKFVWSLAKLPDGRINAATFNGLNTKVIESRDYGHTWKKIKKIKGLVHEIAYLDKDVWYCGARSFYFFKYFWKNGILGVVDKQKYKLKEKACQWSMCIIDDKIATINTLGELILIDKNTAEINAIVMPYLGALYDIEKISPKKYIIVGKGKSIYLVDFN